ncbi:MAG: autotransporter-associated beta strand repeat-containing protein, partial [Chthoniobacterales bacterium]
TYTTSTDGAISTENWAFNNDGTTTHGKLVADSDFGVSGGTETFNGSSSLEATHVDAIHGGTQNFNNTSSLIAGSDTAVNGGTQNFYDTSKLHVDATDGIEGGAQNFYENSTLEAAHAYSVSGGLQHFYDDSKLIASAANALDDGYINFHDDSKLQATATDAITGGDQIFRNDSTLEASHADAITGGDQTFYDDSTLNPTVANAVTGGAQHFYDRSSLTITISNAISGGSQSFVDDSTLTVSAANGITGGQQFFDEDSIVTATVANAISGGVQHFSKFSELHANAANSISGADITLYDDSLITVGATNGLGNASVEFYSSGTQLALGGNSTTVGKIISGGNGVIRNASATPAMLTVNPSSGLTTYSGLIEDGAGGGVLYLGKSGAGTLQLTGANTYTGGTSISGGILLANHNSSLGTGTVTVTPGGTFASGGATIANAVTVGGTISPGNPDNAPVTFTTGSESWDAGGTYRWDIKDAAAITGSWDLISINGSLTINSTPGSPFTIAIFSLDGSNANSNVANFDGNVNGSWVITSATGGITGLELDNMSVDASHFTNSTGPESYWQVTANGNDLVLSYYAIPEPGIWAMLLAGLGLATLALRRTLGTAFSWSMFNWVADVACLAFACYAAGGHPSLAGLTVAYAAARAVGSIPLM